MSNKDVPHPNCIKSDSRPPTLWGMLTVMWRQVQREQTMTICFQIFRKCSKKIKKIIIFFFGLSSTKKANWFLICFQDNWNCILAFAVRLVYIYNVWTKIGLLLHRRDQMRPTLKFWQKKNPRRVVLQGFRSTQTRNSYIQNWQQPNNYN